ncbi:putative endonuclease [Tistlia consotensis]|uniref:Putative endonuclease n=1 Tax=Tistlia consotensis USBA 355 TaxID=560819 RepID=A0A1Y6CNC3_9PROT|nr:GIY-YIG nuclease family protein [Tistlia consotensis]SMF64789.1 putative endonuclease [Tistlia consotensis USBA 355]SNR96550.1 putative endonuclease [Tistlia consotensis]
MPWVYLLRCRDGSYYTGLAQKDLEDRVAKHNAGYFGGYTASRLPVELVFAEHFPLAIHAIEMERRIKTWSRAKKEALIARDWDRLRTLARTATPSSS